MCGIAGVFGEIHPDDIRQRLSRMSKRMSHRGPDAQGIFVNGSVGLAHVRLSIIDLSEAANQPMTDPTGRYTLVFNGEIYNYRQLRKQLPDFQFKTDGDTEVLLAGLIKWGIDFVKECNGMFAFAFYDSDREECYICRDRLGIKPLYYLRSDKQVLFANEIRTLLAGLDSFPAINENALPDYLRYQTVHGPSTILEGVFSLPAGSYLKMSDNEDELIHYWSLLEADRQMSSLNYEDSCRMIRKRLDESVARRLISDVPLGIFLSGGIDSSAIVALASSHGNQKIRTFTIDFDEKEFSESQHAELIARKYETEHHRIPLSPNSLLDQLPNALSAMDHPTGDGINTYVVSGAAKKAGITVALSGLGGDELFAGYPIFKQFVELQGRKWLLSFPGFVRDFAGRFLEWKNPGVASKKTRRVLNQERFDLEYIYPISREVSDPEINSDLLNGSSKRDNSVYKIVADAIGYGNQGFSLPLLSQVSYAEISTYLRNVLLRDTDQMSMAHALEVRVPFLDHELVSTVMGVNDRYKFPHQPKKLLVDAMGDLLPNEITNRAKMGFTFPWEIWMKNELREFCGDMISSLAQRPQFNSKSLHKRWNGFLAGRPDITWSRLWHLCILEAWLSENEG